MDKPVCSEDESVISYVTSREGKIWTKADTLSVKWIMNEIVSQLGAINALAKEALEISGVSSMAKPIQIAATHQRGEHEQFGYSSFFVLCDDGSIWYQDSICGNTHPWAKVEGPWDKDEPTHG